MVKALAASVLWWSGVSAPRRVCSNRLTVFTLHRVLPRELIAAYPFPELCITPSELGQCIRYAARHFDTGPLTAQLAKFRQPGRTGKPLLALTFDDGQWDNYRYAAPLLQEHGIRATFYVPVEQVETGQLIWHDRLGFSGLTLLQAQDGVDRAEEIFAGYGLSLNGQFSLPDICEKAKGLDSAVRLELINEMERQGSLAPAWSRMMSWQEIRDLAMQGHEIGSHSMSHALLPQLGDAGQEWEVRESRLRLQAATGAEVNSFCYPNGSYDDRALRLLRDGPYTNAVSTHMGLHAAQDDDYAIKRIHIDSRCFSKASGGAAEKRIALRVFMSSKANRHTASVRLDEV
jgi:peptidoglycan/xylan/chitin deacetylase (PgdA/CDA1 family)